MIAKLYTTTVIWVDTEGELAEHHTRVFPDYKQALEHVGKVENEWLDMIRERENDFDTDCEVNCVEHQASEEYLYKHYVYEDGKEKVFSLEGHDVEISF